jgi:hypothetical protein
MKQRDPFLNWLLILVTLGQYTWVWTFLLARDANHPAGAELIRIKKHAQIFGAMWGIYVIAVALISFIPIREVAFVPSYILPAMMLLAVTLLGYFLCCCAPQLRFFGGRVWLPFQVKGL